MASEAYQVIEDSSSNCISDQLTHSVCVCVCVCVRTQAEGGGGGGGGRGVMVPHFFNSRVMLVLIVLLYLHDINKEFKINIKN